jgi:hypothetical protein
LENDFLLSLTPLLLLSYSFFYLLSFPGKTKAVEDTKKCFAEIIPLPPPLPFQPPLPQHSDL